MKLPIQCPSCDAALRVSELTCTHCETIIRGNYDLPLYLQLSRDEQAFILNLVASKKWQNKPNYPIPPCETKWTI